MRNVQATYALQQERGAEIVAPLEPKPWGVSEYVVRDLNGYRLRFAGSGSEKAGGALPAEVHIELRLPTGPEMDALLHLRAHPMSLTSFLRRPTPDPRHPDA